MRYPLFVLLAAASLPLRAVDVSPAQPRIPDHHFLLTDFGAVGDAGATVSTAAFQKAIAAVKAAGGGTLEVPEGTFFTQGIDLCSNLNLHLDEGATLLFSPRFDDYKLGPRYRPLIRVADCHDVLVSGQGTLDGNGEAWWPEARRFKAYANAHKLRSNTSPRPQMLSFSNCSRIGVEGITLTDAPVFNVVANDCSDFTCEGLTITNPENSPNTDGIDPKDCQRVLIARCRIDTGDDCVALGGSGEQREEDVLVRDCTFLHGHGCSIGSGTGSGLRHLVVRNCTFDGTETGVRLKSARGRGGLVEDCVYEDLTMNHVGTAISISGYYMNSPSDKALVDDKAQPLGEGTPVWKNIIIRNVVARNGVKRAGIIAGLPEAPAENIRLDHVTIDAPAGLHVINARGVILTAVTIQAADGKPLITERSAQVTSDIPATGGS